MLGASSEVVSIPLGEVNARDNHVASFSSYALWNYLRIPFPCTIRLLSRKL
ncbi:MAG: hypothetical protein QOI53_235 [Verrucomicrobiota bacterium]|nr:hypothetical protein [Verrucomicrobiota bacterium]